MSQVLSLRNLTCGVLVALTALTGAVKEPRKPAGPLAPWGTVKGRVVWGGDKIPARNVLKGLPLELRDAFFGPPLPDEWVIDPATKNVRYVMVWLVPDSRDIEDLVKRIPIHPSLRKLKETTVNVDIQRGRFVPRCLMIREGQSLHFVNNTPDAHNVTLDGGPENPRVGQVLPPGPEFNYGPFKVQRSPIPMCCNVHACMIGYVRVMSHPYFAVTEADGTFVLENAPAGHFRLIVWHPETGWVVGDKEPDKFGRRVEIKPEETTDLGVLKLMPLDPP